MDNKENTFISNDNRNSEAIAFILLFLAILSCLIMLVIYGQDEGTTAYKLRGIVASIGALFYLLANIKAVSCISKGSLRQLLCVNVFLFICSAIILGDVFSGGGFPGISDPIARGSFFICLCIAVCFQVVKSNIHCEFPKQFQWLFVTIKDNALLFILIIGIAAYLVKTYNTIIPMWDGGLLYRHSSLSSIDTIFDLSDAFYFGHIAYSYSAIIAVAKSVFGSTEMALFVVFSVLFLSSIICFYGIIKMIVSDRDKVSYTLCTMIYAFSPYTLGMIHDSYHDLMMIFVFTIIAYLFFSKRNILAVAFSAFFLFIKEPAVIVLSFFILGMIIAEMFGIKGCLIKDKIRVFFSRRYLLIYYLLFIWAIVYIFICHWSKDGDETAWSTYFLGERSKVLFGLNFNWLIVITMVIAILVMIVRASGKFKIIIPLIFVYLGMTIFLLAFPTHNHPRYMGAMVVPMYLICAVGLLSITRKALCIFISAVYALLLLISSFSTIDPVTLSLFPHVNVGTTTLITTGDLLSDSLVYNSQYEGYQKALNSAIDAALTSDSNTIICIPAMHGTTWYCCGIGLSLNGIEDSFENTEYWNFDNSIRHLDKENGDSSVSVIYVTADADFKEIAGDNTVHLIYPPFVGTEEADAVKNQCNVLEYNEYEDGGWIVADLIFESSK